MLLNIFFSFWIAKRKQPVLKLFMNLHLWFVPTNSKIFLLIHFTSIRYFLQQQLSQQAEISDSLLGKFP